MAKSKIKTIQMVISIASSRGVSVQISSTWDAKDYIGPSATPLISCHLFDCNYAHTFLTLGNWLTLSHHVRSLGV
jgi:hypothetical protein